MRAKRRFGLLDIHQIQLPQVNVENFDQTPLKKLFDPFKVSTFHFLLNINLPVAGGGRKNGDKRFIKRPDFVYMT